jgi:hypothetical protein
MYKIIKPPLNRGFDAFAYSFLTNICTLQPTATTQISPKPFPAQSGGEEYCIPFIINRWEILLFPVKLSCYAGD